MPIEVTLALVVSVAGVTAAVVAGRHRRGKATDSRTLVPHRTRQLMAVLQSGASVIDREGRAVASNALATALGLARPDGAPLPEVVQLAELAWSRGEPQEADVTVRRGIAGTSATVHVRVSPIDENVALALANDRTEQRVAEMTRREFAVNVSHELTTPIGALVLLAETLEAVADDPEAVREFSAKIGKESRRLSKLIQEIIEISRIQGADDVLDRRNVTLKDVVGEAVDAAQTQAKARGIALSVSHQAKPSVLGDRDLLVMAVRNLVDNAVAYSDAGGAVTVVLSAEDDVASIAVIDRGIGIASGERERIFERFYRTDPARSRETGGTGLGLSIVKHIAAQHDGEVTLWSRLGVGSTFTLRLPVAKKGAGA
jgi:two-component system sensor histidine kinase SenX3